MAPHPLLPRAVWNRQRRSVENSGKSRKSYAFFSTKTYPRTGHSKYTSNTHNIGYARSSQPGSNSLYTHGICVNNRPVHGEKCRSVVLTEEIDHRLTDLPVANR